MKILFLFLLTVTTFLADEKTTLQSNENISNKTKIVIGIRAWKGVDLAYKEWSSTIDYLNKHVDGYEFELYPLVQYEKIKEKIKNRDIDFLISDPVMYVETENLYGVTRLATLQRKAKGFYFDKFGSTIFTSSKNKNINNLQDLKDTTLMGVSQTAFAGYRIAYRELLNNGIKPENTFKNIIFSNGRGDIVVKEVLKNKNYVGTVRTGLLENMIKKDQIKRGDFKIINQQNYTYFPLMASTKLYPEYPFSRLSHVSEELGKKVLIALLSIQETSQAAKDGKYARWLIPNDYTDITNLMKELHIGIYKDFNKITFRKIIEQHWISSLVISILILLLIILLIRIKRQAIILEKEKDKVSKIFNSLDSLVILTDGEKLHMANQKFLEFFNIDKLDQCTENYHCICENFEYEEGEQYLQKYHNEKHWNHYIKSSPDKIHKIKMKNTQGEFHIFKVNVTAFDHKRSLDIITFYDITSIKNLEKLNNHNAKLLHEQSKMVALGEMIGNIAHQWRQPLSIISTAASGAKIQKELGLINDHEIIDTLDKITNTTLYLSKTIDDFQDFIKGNSKKTIFNLNKEIEKCLTFEEGTLKVNHIKVIKEIDKTITLNNLPNGLSQSLINIINNAKDAMKSINSKDHKLLFISAKKEKEHVRIRLKDNGGGIKEDIIDKIFDPYFTTKHKSQGTGLGLHMTYKIVTENMNGSIEVSNETYTYNDKEYKGAVFSIMLPLHT